MKLSRIRETLKTPPEMAQSLTRKCEKGGREEETSTCAGTRCVGWCVGGVGSLPRMAETVTTTGNRSEAKPRTAKGERS